MEAIKKKIAALKMEMDAANEMVEANETKARQQNQRADFLYDEVRDTSKKLVTLEHDYEVAKVSLETQTVALEQCEKSWTKAEQDRTVLTKRVQEIEQSLSKKEELRLLAQAKLEKAVELADDAKRMCKVLEDRNRLDLERMEKLTSELKDARLIAEDADNKSEEIANKLSWVEEELEAAEERVKNSEAKIVEREDELFIVKNIVKSLEVSEQKANQRVADSKIQLKELKGKVKAADKRAILAEKAVRALQKEVDMKEDDLREQKEKCREITDELDLTFAEMTGY
ncbi:tropomyosin-2 [Fopius arisanus]|uniref:Tropomyosin-2 n=2 Tax=Fopius arisanus TaxID=64838 RepID=A0A9R1TBN3_9HYME|nr:PREDICTED: tropomyosin-2-like [Fopius arisanus]XP_011307190.1 PREDICTED: tropomyosin-2-like [Fopius arisanus]XP_011307191.1 PREDICTED: tropomyosin-2-like [Fopius arisanus]